ncbi:hypothetical protein ABPG74_007741 [Tetrahymena malaccensis]
MSPQQYQIQNQLDEGRGQQQGDDTELLKEAMEFPNTNQENVNCIQHMQIQLENKYDHEFQSLLSEIINNNKQQQNQKQIFNEKAEHFKKLVNSLLTNQIKYARDNKKDYKLYFDLKIKSRKLNRQGLVIQGIANFKDKIESNNYFNNCLIIFENLSKNIFFTSQILSYNKNVNYDFSDSEDDFDINDDEENSKNDVDQNNPEKVQYNVKNRDNKTFSLKILVHINRNNYLEILKQLILQECQTYLVAIQSKDFKSNFFVLKSLIDDENRKVQIEKIKKDSIQLSDQSLHIYPEYSFLDAYNQKDIFFECIKQKAESLRDSYGFNQSQIECIKYMLTRSVALIQNDNQFYQNQNMQTDPDQIFNKTKLEGLKILLDFYSRQENKKPILIICQNTKILNMYKFNLIKHTEIYEIISKTLDIQKKLKFNNFDRLNKIFKSDQEKNQIKIKNQSQKNLINQKEGYQIISQIFDSKKTPEFNKFNRPSKIVNKDQEKDYKQIQIKTQSLKNQLNELFKKQKITSRSFELKKLIEFQEKFNKQESVQKICFQSKIIQLLIGEYFKDFTEDQKNNIMKNGEKIFKLWSKLDLSSEQLQNIIEIELTPYQRKNINYNLKLLKEQHESYKYFYQSSYLYKIIFNPIILDTKGKQLDNFPISFSKFFNSFQKLSQITYYDMMSILDYISFFTTVTEELSQFIQDFETKMFIINQNTTQQYIENLSNQDVILATVSDSITYYQAIKNINPEIIIIDSTYFEEKDYQVAHIISSFQPKHLIYFRGFLKFKADQNKDNGGLIIQQKNYNQLYKLINPKHPYFKTTLQTQQHKNELQLLVKTLLNDDDLQLNKNSQISYFVNEFEIPAKYIIIIHFKNHEMLKSEDLYNNIKYIYEQEKQKLDSFFILQNVYYQENKSFIIITCRLKNEQPNDMSKLQIYKIQFKQQNININLTLLAQVATFLDQNVLNQHFRYIKLAFNLQLDLEIESYK